MPNYNTPNWFSRNLRENSAIGFARRGDYRSMAYSMLPYSGLIAMARGGDPLGPNNSLAFRDGVAMGPPTAGQQLAANNPVPEIPGGGNAFSNWLRGRRSNRTSSPSSESNPSQQTQLTDAQQLRDWFGRNAYGRYSYNAPDRGVYGGARYGAGGSSTNPLIAGNATPSLGRLMMNSPWRQSGGENFGPRAHAQ